MRLTIIVIALALTQISLSNGLRINCGSWKKVGNFLPDGKKYYGRTAGKVTFLQQNGWQSRVYATQALQGNGKPLIYAFKVAKGAKVYVKAYFSEPWQNGKNRVLDVIIGGATVRKNLVVAYAAGGRSKPYSVVRQYVSKGGNVVVKIVARKGNAMLSALEVHAKGGVKAAGTGDSTWNTEPSESKSKPSPSKPSPSKPSKNTQQPGPAATSVGSWRTVSPEGNTKPVARHEACAVMVQGKVYLLGGRGMRPVNEYNPKTRKWRNLGKAPKEFNHMQCVAVGSVIYIVGAWYGRFPRESAHEKTWTYNVATGKWATLPGLPPGRRRGGGAAVVHNGKIFLAMGNIGGHGGHATTLGMLDSFDLKTKRWTALASAPDPRDHVGGAVVRDRKTGRPKLCVGAGRNGGVANFWSAPVMPVNCYDFGSGKWTRGANIPVGRAGAATAATCGGLMMIAGGEGRSKQGGGAYSRVDLYDVTTNSFRTPTFLKRNRHGSGLAVADCSCGNIYLPSGSGSLGGGPELTSMEVWSPDGKIRNNC